jgi:CRISPR-associated protein Cst2
MSKHLFGLVVTPFGTAANNRGETEGNITTLQKILWKGEVHTTVSAEAIRFAIRWFWQRHGGASALNRRWDDEASRHTWSDAEFAGWTAHLDDDVLGFMSAKAAKEEANEGEAAPKKRRARGTCDKRRARLEITRAISLTPFAGDITFNAASPGATPSASSTGKDPVPYGTEVHATRYQYGFALTPEELHDKARALDVVDAIVSLSEVAGNQARFLFDFSPEAIVFRWTDDFAPRILHAFCLDGEGKLAVPEIVARIEARDIEAGELVVGGALSEEQAQTLDSREVPVHPGVKAAAEEIKQTMKGDLGLS